MARLAFFGTMFKRQVSFVLSLSSVIYYYVVTGINLRKSIDIPYWNTQPLICTWVNSMPGLIWNSSISYKAVVRPLQNNTCVSI